MKNPKTRVYFVKTVPDEDYPDPEITAIFPDDQATPDPKTRICYAHLGQHGSCHLDWVKEQNPATPQEYADLKAELETHFDYKLIVLERMPG